jgi:hypothetical protein
MIDLNGGILYMALGTGVSRDPGLEVDALGMNGHGRQAELFAGPALLALSEFFFKLFEEFVFLFPV